MKMLSLFVFAILCSFAASQDEVAVVVAVDSVEVTENQAVEAAVEACGCTKPASAKSAFESVLNAFSANLLADVSTSFAPGAAPTCLAESHLQKVSFGTPSYSIDLPQSVVGKVTWEYQFEGSEQTYTDGSLVFSVQTDVDNKITSLLLSHVDDLFDQRIPRALPTSVGALVNEFFGGLSSFNLRESLEHTSEDFTLRILGDTSLFPHHLDTVITRTNFAEFKDEAGQVFDFSAKSVRCLLESEDEDSSASHCQVVGKHARVKFCLDALVLAEAKNGLLSSIDFYIAGACDPKTKFEDDEERAEKVRKETEKQEARRREEERKAEKVKEDAERKALEAEKKAQEAERKAVQEAERKAQETEKKSQKEKSKKKDGEKQQA